MENEERPRCALEMPAVNRWSVPGWCTIAHVACRAKSAARAGRQNRREILATDFTDFYGLPEGGRAEGFAMENAGMIAETRQYVPDNP